ncbi:MAG: mitofilin family membrane protein [Alphaproteobacteria bacterium]|jgi:hypothetical protein|nr:mitofilin family membrane protein [Alphaproteobacteria bacterium]MDP6568037.1 mitofilin family membrane protein [Alphaproteobacteria bacterium]MDP6814177.1 mitofilin family membrane protein [Alphaproteobacteria bacterium]
MAKGKKKQDKDGESVAEVTEDVADEPIDDQADHQADDQDGETAAEVTDVVADAPAEDEAAATKKTGGRGPMLALAILVVAVVLLYVAWPTIRQAAVAMLPQEAPEVLGAVQELDHRVAQLEAADRRLDQALTAARQTSEAVVGKLGALNEQLAALARAAPSEDLLARMNQQIVGLEKTFADLAAKAGDDGSAAVAALTAELAGLKSRLGELATKGDGGEDLAALRTEAEAARRQAAELAAQNTSLKGQVTGLAERLASLEQSASAGAGSSRGGALVLAAGQLHRAVLSGAPYQAPLGALAALAGDDAKVTEALATLKPWAASGVSTPQVLNDRFPAMARRVLRAGTDEETGVWRQTLDRLSSLVTVRRVGEVAGDQPDAVLARAERRLADGNLAASVSELGQLQGPAAAAAADWLALAEARIATLAALDQLQARAIATMAGG